jgi:ribonucleoside-diphosphate reductase alpha chain
MQTGSESVEQESVASTPAATRENPNPTRLSATAPGQLRVIKRNGTVVPFEDSKITVAITKAFLAVEGGTAAASSRIHETVANLTSQVVATFQAPHALGRHAAHRGHSGSGRAGIDARRRAQNRA